MHLLFFFFQVKPKRRYSFYPLNDLASDQFGLFDFASASVATHTQLGYLDWFRTLVGLKRSALASH